MIKRADPSGCGCTDCLTGHSKPFSSLDDAERQGLRDGLVYDSTSGEFAEYLSKLRGEPLITTSRDLEETLKAQPDPPKCALIEYQGERGIAIRLGENLCTGSWKSGDVIVFWSGGDATVLPNQFQLIALNLFNSGVCG